MTTLPAFRRASVVPRSLSVALSLGRAEARQVVRHPMTIVGVVLSVAITVVMTWRYVPVLNRYDALTNDSLIPLAAAILLVAHLATGRSRRYGTTELFEGLATSDVTITAGHLMSVLYVSCFAFVLVIAELAYMKVIGGVTSPRPVVIFVGPALVAFTGAFGVALGRWAPRIFMGPLGLVGLVAFCTVTMTNIDAHDFEWLSLWVQSEVLKEIASEVGVRPYGWRLLYIAGLALTAIGAAFARYPSKRFVATGLALAALAGTAYAGSRQMRGGSREEQRAVTDRLAAALDDPRCREYASVDYCPLPGYEPWIERWRKPTEGVLAAAPAEARPEDLRFLQAPSEQGLDWDDPVSNWIRRARRRGVLSLETDITPTLNWGRNGTEGTSELAVALLVAGRTIGADSPRRGRSCSLLEQGRSIVALWLAAQATEGTEAALASVAARNPYLTVLPPNETFYLAPAPWALQGPIYDYAGNAPLAYGIRELGYASQLLEKDKAGVRSTVAENWNSLTDPATTSDQAAAILGLDPLTPLGEAVEEWGYVRNYRGLRRLGVGPPCR